MHQMFKFLFKKVFLKYNCLNKVNDTNNLNTDPCNILKEKLIRLRRVPDLDKNSLNLRNFFVVQTRITILNQIV